MRSRAKLGDASLVRVDRVIRVLQDLSDFWPLTLRQVYYQLVAAGVIENNRKEYQRLSGDLTRARLEGLVPWDAIEDRARSMLVSGGWASAEEFKAEQAEDFLSGYRRDLLASQEHALELWVEKDALSRVCHGIAFDYCVPVVVARGFSSVSYVHECAERIKQRFMARGRPTVILYAGDLDPSGWEMLPAMLDTLAEMGCGSLVKGERFALNPEQVERYALPTNPDALKDSDARAPKYRARFGDLAVELDALPPAVLQDEVRAAIESHLDLDALEVERQRQEEDRASLVAVRERVLAALNP